VTERLRVREIDDDEGRRLVVEHGLEERALDLLLAALKEKGLVKAGWKQRTDSTHVVAAVRDLNRLELAGESCGPAWRL